MAHPAIAEKDATIAELQAKVNDLTHENTTAIAERDTTIAKLREKVDDLNHENTRQFNEIAGERRSIREKDEEISKLKKDLRTKNTEHTKLQKEFTDVKKIKDGLQAEETKLKEKLSNAQKLASERNQTVESLKKDLRSSAEQNRRVENERYEQQKARELVESEVEDAKADIADLDATITAQNQQLDQQGQQLQRLGELEDLLEALLPGWSDGTVEELGHTLREWKDAEEREVARAGSPDDLARPGPGSRRNRQFSLQQEMQGMRHSDSSDNASEASMENDPAHDDEPTITLNPPSTTAGTAPPSQGNAKVTCDEPTPTPATLSMSGIQSVETIPVEVPRYSPTPVTLSRTGIQSVETIPVEVPRYSHTPVTLSRTGIQSVETEPVEVPRYASSAANTGPTTQSDALAALASLPYWVWALLALALALLMAAFGSAYFAERNIWIAANDTTRQTLLYHMRNAGNSVFGSGGGHRWMERTLFDLENVLKVQKGLRG